MRCRYVTGTFLSAGQIGCRKCSAGQRLQVCQARAAQAGGAAGSGPAALAGTRAMLGVGCGARTDCIHLCLHIVRLQVPDRMYGLKHDGGAGCPTCAPRNIIDRVR